ncbi:MAG: hypothetical protein OES09_03405 [Gammaproteobacteria bacterium]|nr:hypothetical protein [Gammaproteobacteria bacterium]
MRPNNFSALEFVVCLVVGSQSRKATKDIDSLLAEHLPRLEIHWVQAGHMDPVTHAHLGNPLFEAFTRGFAKPVT